MKYLLLFEKFESTYLYHGSDVDFDEFSDEKISTGDSSEMFGKGYYLTNNYDIAKHYAILMAKKHYIIGYQKGIFDTEVPILSKEADKITDKEFKVNKFEISGNILNVDTFELDEKFLNKIKEICTKYSHYPDEFQDKNFNRVIDWAKNHKHEIHNYRGELWYIISHLLFEDKKMVEDLITYIKSLGYDGIKYRSDRSFEGINDWNYCIYNKNIIKKVKDINEDVDKYYTNRKQIIKNNQIFYLCQPNEVQKNIFTIEDLNGTEIGRATLNKDNYLDNIRIDEKYRRIGLATELYNFIEQVKNIKLNPSPIKQSKEIVNYWNKKIKNFESFNMDDLLDKINKSGINSLTNLEKDFMKAHAEDDEEKLRDIEIKSKAKTFTSSNNLFSFDYNGRDMRIDDDRILYYGTMWVPSIEFENGEKIEGKLDGSIEDNDGILYLHFSMYYNGQEYSIEDFCKDLIYELYDFIQYVLDELNPPNF